MSILASACCCSFVAFTVKLTCTLSYNYMTIYDKYVCNVFHVCKVFHACKVFQGMCLCNCILRLFEFHSSLLLLIKIVEEEVGVRKVPIYNNEELKS